MSLEDMSIDELVGDEPVNEEIATEATEEVVEEVVEDKPKLFKVKIDGIESEVTEEELVKNYQLEQASRKRLEESSKQLKTLTEALKVGRENPAELLAWLGIDMKQFLTSQVKHQLEEAKLSPEQKELRDLRKLKQEQETRSQLEKEKLAQERQQQEFSGVAQKLENEILDALAEKKASKALISDVARIMLSGLDSGKPITAQEAVKLALKDTSSRLQAVLDESDEEFFDNLSPQAQEKLRKKLLSKVTTTSKTSKPQPDKRTSKKESKSNAFDNLFSGSRTL
jgi:hypothetical protein